MARPIKNNADYFSHDNDMRDDERIKAVRRKFSHIGYSTWNMLLERLCRAENFKIEYSEESIDIMAGDFNIEPLQLKEIIDYLIKLKLIIQEGNVIYSQTMITRFEGLFRKRKRDAEKLSPAITPISNIIADDNTQSKVKDSKVNKSKEEEIKEKGNTENLSPLFFHSENSKEEIISTTKTIFEKYAPKYVWERKDREQLLLLLQKICLTKTDLKTAEQLTEAFDSFLQKLPDYWRSKKFTIPNLNSNYNEIISEIRAKQNSAKSKNSFVKPIIIPKAPEIKREPTPEEKIKLRKYFINSISESYEKYVVSGQHGYLPLWTMHDTLVKEGVLKLSAKKLEQYRNQAIAARKAELQKPKHAHEVKAFGAMIENFDKEMQRGTEKHRIDNAVKSLAVQGLFEGLKNKNTDIKILFKK
ncbi:MAG: DUF4373 domain-containing protein [Bacteroidia bacterium]